MRIIHTSDWHLGRQFGPMSLRADQEAFADWLVDLVEDQGAELLVIAGDLYDRAIAPVDAIELFRTTVRRVRSAGAVVAAITGNHDGADRVASYSELLDASGFYLRGGYERVGQVITHEFSDGPLDLALLPFLDPQAAPDGFGVDQRDAGTGAGDRDPGDGRADEDASDPGHNGEGHSTVDLVEQRRRRTHDSVLDAAAALARESLGAPRSLAVAHAYVTGATPSESERQLVVGGTGEVPSTVFGGFSYTALGHLHRPQTAGAETVRYSGTPLAYSFSEQHDKSVVVIDMEPDGTATIEQVPVGVGRRVRTVEGAMAHLLGSRDLDDAHDCFVRAVVTDRSTVLDARATLARRFPHIVEVRLMPDGKDPDVGAAPIDVSELPPIEAVRQFWGAAEGSEPPEDIDGMLVTATGAALAGGTP